jgi:hypothetical protein
MITHCVIDRQNSRLDGFALVLALLLMAFVLLLLLCMTTLLQVESRAASNSLQVLHARESARLALMLAIGELQKHAGPDQRVTARADILGDGNFVPSTKFWTGVWDTTDPTAAPTWLVSGENVDPSIASIDTMQLVGTGSAGTDTTQHVTAPRLEVLDRNGNVSDEIAWWISDEGVKASVGTLPLNLREKPHFLKVESVDDLQLLIASTQGLEAIFSKYDRYTSADASTLGRINSVEQLLAQPDFLEANADFSDEAPFHVLTPRSYGVLANTLTGNEGGLMQDLSLFPALLGDGLKEYIEIGEEHADILGQLNDPVASKRLFTQIQGLDDIGPLNDGDIAMPIIPVLSNFMMAFTITSQEPVSANPNFVLRARFFCEFWNPFSHTLSMNSSGGDPIDLELEITGLPEVTVERVGSAIVSVSAPINLQTLMSDPSSPDNAMTIRLVNDISEPWLPGRSKNWVGIETTIDPVRSPYQSIVTLNKQWDKNENTLGKTGPTGKPSGIDTGEPRFPGSLLHTSPDEHTLRIKIYIKSDTDRQLLADLDGFVYEPVSTRPSGYGNTHASTTFGYHIMLREPHHSDDDIEYPRGLWLYDHDPRSPIPQIRDDWQLSNDRDFDTGSPFASVINGLQAVSTAQPEVVSEFQNTIDSDRSERLFDRTQGSHDAYNKLWQDAPLFELPRERILALASLQHIYIHNERPFQVGNSWGDERITNTSAWFDRYYFSGLSRSDDINEFESGVGPTNPALTYYDEEGFLANFVTWQNESSNDVNASKELAKTLMVANRFNINSTSVAAWKAVLASLRLNDFEYLDYPEDDTSDLGALTISNDSRGGTFARFSHSLEETYEAPQTPLLDGVNPVAPSAYYRHGARRFDKNEFENLAQAIVDRIKLRGTPFVSMESFLSADTGQDQSLIEQAIATVFAPSGKQQWDHQWETEGTRGPAADTIDIDHFSPGFLTQADIMTAIGPMLAPRSDTFKIRARGESFSPQGIAIGSATIEATLQRIPQVVDSTVAINQPTERKIKLISLRWLADDEL